MSCPMIKQSQRSMIRPLVVSSSPDLCNKRIRMRSFSIIGARYRNDQWSAKSKPKKFLKEQKDPFSLSRQEHDGRRERTSNRNQYITRETIEDAELLKKPEWQSSYEDLPAVRDRLPRSEQRDTNRNKSEFLKETGKGFVGAFMREPRVYFKGSLEKRSLKRFNKTFEPKFQKLLNKRAQNEKSAINRNQDPNTGRNIFEEVEQTDPQNFNIFDNLGKKDKQQSDEFEGVFQKSEALETEVMDAYENIPKTSLLPRPEHPVIKSDTRHVMERLRDGWKTRSIYNQSFSRKFSRHPHYMKIISNKLGTLDTSNIVSPVDFARAKPEHLEATMTKLKQEYGEFFHIDRNYQTIDPDLVKDIMPKTFEKGDVVILCGGANRFGDKGIVVGPVDCDLYHNAIDFGRTDKTNSMDGYIVVRIRNELVDPLFRFSLSREKQNTMGIRMKSFGARVEIEAKSMMVKTNHKVQFDFLDNPKIFDHFVDPIERPFLEERIINPELKKRFEEDRDLYLWVGAGKSAEIIPERM